MKYSKCRCKVPDIENWVLLRKLTNRSVVYCRACGSVWRTEAKYVKELRYSRSPFEYLSGQGKAKDK